MKENVRVTDAGNVMVKIGLIGGEPYEILFQKVKGKEGNVFYIVKACRLWYDANEKQFKYDFEEGNFLSKNDIKELIYALVELIK